MVLYEDNATRDTALRLCDHLTEKFKGDLRFKCSWWGFKFFNVPAIAQEAAESARSADLLMVAIRDSGNLPATVKQWLEQWALQPKPAEGALVSVRLSVAKGTREDLAPDLFFRFLAQRARRDYVALCENESGFEGSPEEQLFPAEEPAESDRLDRRFWGWGIND
jgi:hypothetical protein